MKDVGTAKFSRTASGDVNGTTTRAQRCASTVSAEGRGTPEPMSSRPAWAIK